MKRIDRAARLIRAPVSIVYGAFRKGDAMQSWLPPEGMSGNMLAFDFREGGSYRMRLTYSGVSHPPGKSAESADEVGVTFIKLVENQCIEQSVVYESDKPGFSGVMKMTCKFQKADGGTEVSVTCRDVPLGISQEDHQAGIAASLKHLAEYTEQNASVGGKHGF